MNHPSRGSINMNYITKAKFTVEQKHSQQCNPCHLSAEAFAIVEYRMKQSKDVREIVRQLFSTYRWGSPHQWSLWLQGGLAGTAYTLHMQ